MRPPAGFLGARVLPQSPVRAHAIVVRPRLLGVEPDAEARGPALELAATFLGQLAGGADRGLDAEPARRGAEMLADHHEVVGVAEGVGEAVEPILEWLQD